MTKDPVCVRSDNQITKARSLMRRHGFRALPVVDETLVGIISRSDVLRVTSSKTNITVNGLMSTNMVIIKPDDDVLAAAQLIVSSGVRQLPVVDGDLVGIITSLDILQSFVEENYVPHASVIGGLMNRDVIYCGPNDELSQVWELMSKKRFSGLPVVKNEILGMVTLNDILRHGKARISKESGKSRSIDVRKVMSTPAITADKDTLTREVAGIMTKKRILRVPISSKGKLVGIVDVEDVLKAYTK